jgi:hypothetical protein
MTEPLALTAVDDVDHSDRCPHGQCFDAESEDGDGSGGYQIAQRLDLHAGSAVSPGSRPSVRNPPVGPGSSPLTRFT